MSVSPHATEIFTIAHIALAILFGYVLVSVAFARYGFRVALDGRKLRLEEASDVYIKVYATSGTILFFFVVLVSGGIRPGNDVVTDAIACLLFGGSIFLVLPLVSQQAAWFVGFYFVSPIREHGTRAREARDERRRQAEEAEQVRLQREEYDRAAPERERAQAEAQRRAESEAHEKASAQIRREDARLVCELLYNLHAPDIGGRLRKAALDDFIKRHMGDERTPEYVEQRSQQLKGIIQQHLDRVRPSPKFTSIEEVARWFREQKQSIEALDVDDRVKKVHLAELSERYAEMTSRLMEEAHT
jgi:hypothetical protein